MDMTPRRTLTRQEWTEAYRAARICRTGDRPHQPVNMLAKWWALNQIKT